MPETMSDKLGEILSHKKDQKTKLSKDLSLKPSKPLVALILDKELSSQEENLLGQIIQAAASIDLQIVVLADTNLTTFKKNQQITPTIRYSRNNRHKVLQAADIAISFNFNDVQEMLLHGTIPVSIKRPELINYNPNKETGNGFIYEKQNSWSIFAALVRALETYKFPYDWKNIVRFGLESVSV